MSSLISGLLFVLAVHSVLSETYEEIQKACAKETGFDGDIDKLNYNDPNIPKEAKAYCLVKASLCAFACELEKQGVLKADGSIDKEKQKHIMEDLVDDEGLKKKFLKAIDECDTPATKNKCEAAFEFVKCVDTKAGLV